MRFYFVLAVLVLFTKQGEEDAVLKRRRGAYRFGQDLVSILISAEAWEMSRPSRSSTFLPDH